MTRLIMYSLTLIMALLCLSAWAETLSEAPADDKTPEYLFVLNAQSGEIKKIGDNQYTLTLKHTDIDHVLMFSDRPYRIARYITAEELADSWVEGEDSFEKSPPNAGLVAHGVNRAVAVELYVMSVSKGVTIVRFSVVGPTTQGALPTYIGRIGLFIDDRPKI